MWGYPGVPLPLSKLTAALELGPSHPGQLDLNLRCARRLSQASSLRTIKFLHTETLNCPYRAGASCILVKWSSPANNLLFYGAVSLGVGFSVCLDFESTSAVKRGSAATSEAHNSFISAYDAIGQLMADLS
jgi:hypothetical protein